MFDNALPKVCREFRFGDITVAVYVVDDEAGAVQSGHYMWPASPVLCSYLVDHWQALPHGAVLELGAGVGLAGHVAARLEGTTSVIFTDHDFGVLEVIEDTISKQQRDSEGSGAGTGGAKVARTRCVRLPWGPLGKQERDALFEALQGGDDLPPESDSKPDLVKSTLLQEQTPTINVPLQGPHGEGGAQDEAGNLGGKNSLGVLEGWEEAFSGDNECGETLLEVGVGAHLNPNTCDAGLLSGRREEASFDLIIASDVIYSASVVEPLFHTVSSLLRTSPLRINAQKACSTTPTPILSSPEIESAGMPLKALPFAQPLFLMCQSFS
ncbi:unnamed protein product, partial [Choristocarpus tenellus]